MTYEQLIDDLSKKKYSPIYFLYGEEPYYIDKVSDYISENVLTEAEKSFNYSLFTVRIVMPEPLLPLVNGIR